MVARFPRKKRFSFVRVSYASLIISAFLGLVISLLTLSQPAFAQQSVLRIVAIVNDDVISMFDLEARARLAVIIGKLDNSALNDRRFVMQVLRDLIDEKLKKQEAERLNIRANKRDIDREIASIAASSNLSPNQFFDALNARGITEETYRDYIGVQVQWLKVARRQLRRQVQINDDDIDDELASLVEAANQPQKKLYEIFLETPEPDLDTEIRRTAVQIIEQFRQGSPFPDLARTFSNGSSASQGGALGWVAPSQLRPELQKEAEDLGPGEISDPIQTFTGYYLLYVEDQRQQTADPNESRLNIVQLSLAVSQNATETERSTAIATLDPERRSIQSCPDALALGDRLANARATRIPDIRLGDMNQQLKEAVLTARAGDVVGPIVSARSVALVTICERSDAGISLPSREEILNRIGSERMELLGRRYLRDLRRDAFIDIRL